MERKLFGFRKMTNIETKGTSFILKGLQQHLVSKGILITKQKTN
jgi:hypothetical protein